MESQNAESDQKVIYIASEHTTVKDITFEHNPGDHEDPMGGPTWLVGIVGAIILIVVLFGVQAVLKATERDTADEFVTQLDLSELNSVRARGAERMVDAPRVVEYIDENGQVQTRVAIPIDDAIKVTLRDFGGGAAGD